MMRKFMIGLVAGALLVGSGVAAGSATADVHPNTWPCCVPR